MTKSHANDEKYVLIKNTRKFSYTHAYMHIKFKVHSFLKLIKFYLKKNDFFNSSDGILIKNMINSYIKNYIQKGLYVYFNTYQKIHNNC